MQYVFACILVPREATIKYRLMNKILPLSKKNALQFTPPELESNNGFPNTYTYIIYIRRNVSDSQARG